MKLFCFLALLSLASAATEIAALAKYKSPVRLTTIPSISPPFTLSAKFILYEAARGYVFSNHVAGTSNRCLDLFVLGDEKRVAMFYGNNKVFYTDPGAPFPALTPRKWHTIALTVDASNYAQFYLDGVALEGKQLDSAPTTCTAEEAWVGKRVGDAYPFKGDVAQVEYATTATYSAPATHLPDFCGTNIPYSYNQYLAGFASVVTGAYKGYTFANSVGTQDDRRCFSLIYDGELGQLGFFYNEHSCGTRQSVYATIPAFAADSQTREVGVIVHSDLIRFFYGGSIIATRILANAVQPCVNGAFTVGYRTPGQTFDISSHVSSVSFCGLSNDNYVNPITYTGLTCGDVTCAVNANDEALLACQDASTNPILEFYTPGYSSTYWLYVDLATASAYFQHMVDTDDCSVAYAATVGLNANSIVAGLAAGDFTALTCAKFSYTDLIGVIDLFMNECTGSSKTGNSGDN